MTRTCPPLPHGIELSELGPDEKPSGPPPLPRELVIAALNGASIGFVRDEGELQSAIAAVLRAASIAFEEQVRLGPGERIDFLCDGVGLELKTQGGLAPLLRQLDRYAASERVDSLIVVSTRRQLVSLPAEIRGKRIFGVWAGSL